MFTRLTQIAGFALLVAGIALLAFVALRPDEADAPPAPTVVEAELTPTPVPQPPPPSVSPILTIELPSIGVKAPIVNLGVDPDGTMQSPSTPTDVAWYTFSSYPGHGSNAVFAGHVDFIRYGPAVFYDLRKLVQGDEIIITLEDQTVYRYKVISSHSYDSTDAPVEEIVGPTENEVVTLITCDGVFNTRTREYDQRLIVRAERISTNISASN